MKYKTPSALIITVIVIIALLHFGGTYLHWYWRLHWYNQIVHFLSGALVAFVTLFIAKSWWALKKWPLFFIAIFSALAVGVLWEMFQLKYGITVWGGPGYAADTTHNIIADLLGGLLGFLYFISKYQTGIPWIRE